jgi:subtilisin family serine protease
LLAVSVVVFSQLVAPRVSLVARGHLPPRSISISISISDRDDRAAVTARIPGGATALRKLGFDAQLLAGDVALLRVDRAELQKLLATPNLIQVEERRIFHPLLDQAAPLVGAPAARMESGLDGTGALVGFVDTGADARHADLRDSSGKTKIAALLDISIPDDNRHPEIGAFGGSIWTRDEIDAAIAAEEAGLTPMLPFPSNDTAGHGTHVAGIATSTGLATGNGLPTGRYVGIAPGADLVIAKASHDGNQFSENDVLNGCKFALAAADRLNRPLVLNLSLGGAGGPHDGTTNTEEALSALFPGSARGRVLVVAAGNEGLTDAHAGGWALDGSVEIPFHVGSNKNVSIDVWTTPPVDIRVKSSSEDVSVKPGEVNHASVIAIDHTTAVRGDGRSQSAIVLTAPSTGDYKVILSGRALRWDFWVSEGDARFTDHIDENDRLAIPGSTKNAISVASLVSKNQWVTVDAQTITRNIEIGNGSLFSSSGPSFDGRFAPDLAAPGEFVASALSRDAHPDSPSSDFFVSGMTTFGWADDGVHGLLRGTSQAAPFVAGAVALLFQLDASLTADQVREILRASAQGSGWSPRLGFGRLDLPSALAVTRGRVGASLDPDKSSVGVSFDQIPPGESRSTITVTPRDSSGIPLGAGHSVTLSISAGQLEGSISDLGFGRYEQSVIAHAARGQVGVITASVDGVQLSAHPKIFFVNGRDEIGQPFHAGGGCSTTGDAGSLWATLLLLMLSKGCRPKSRRL